MPRHDSPIRATFDTAGPKRPLRVMAGPGTGKTRWLMNRVAWLLNAGVDPKRVWLVTFTRVAARDLQRKLDKLGTPGARQVRAGTLHSFCLSALKKAHVFDLTGRTARPLLEFEKRFLLEDLHSPELGNYPNRKDQLKAFEAAWAREQDQDPGWPGTAEDQAFERLLNSWLRFHQGILLSELVPRTLSYLRGNPLCPERLMFDHVLVDEYQDLNRAEQTLIDLLSENASLTIAGDPNQSIYESLKYARPEGIKEFDATHPDTHDIPLEQCGRCPRRIVEMANSLIQHNTLRTDQLLTPKPSAPQGEIHVVQWRDLPQEAVGLSDFIRKRIESGQFDASKTLVLCPRRQMGYMIRDALRDRGIPAHSFFHSEALEGNPKKLDETTNQQAFTLLTLLADPQDRVALRSWLGFGHRNLGRDQYRRLRDYCVNEGASPRQVLDGLCAGSLSVPYTDYLVTRYGVLNTRLQQLANITGIELCNALFPEDQDWAEPFLVLSQELSQESTPSEILDTLRTSITQPELPTDVDYVRVMSLHKAKGLTADHVIIAGFIQGLIPSLRDNLSPRERARSLEEQRRLFYVAITRGRSTLVLSSVLHLPRDLAYKMLARVKDRTDYRANTMTSTFLDELGPSRPDPVRGPAWRY